MSINHGIAQSDGFLLQEATLLLGAVGQAKDLTIEENSIGLFKNLQIQNTKTYTDLTQGVTNQVVNSVLTENRFTITGEGYEFNAKQLAFALGQEGYLLQNQTSVSTKTTADALVAATTIEVADASGISAGDWVIITPSQGLDNGMAYTVESVTTNEITLDRALAEAFGEGSLVTKAKIISSSAPSKDSCSGSTGMSAKIISQKTNCEPVIILFEKVRVTSGFSLAFGSADYANIPYELTSLALTPSDNGYDEWIKSGGDDFKLLTG